MDAHTNARSVLTAMSGGVDSTVAAALLQKQGYTVAGATLKLFDTDEARQSRTCCSLSDVEDAKAACVKLGIPHYVFNFKDRFESTVIRRFVDAYLAGKTPNPCIDCNRFVKITALLERAWQLGFDGLATGHYARGGWNAMQSRPLLKKARDADKDQTYVLYMLTPMQLNSIQFPLGDLTKGEVREAAADYGFWNAEKPDSQDICFVPDGDYGSFLERYLGRTFPPGNFVGEAGQILGQHRGYQRYTIGQRKGLGLALPAPAFVWKIDPDANAVHVGNSSRLYSDTLLINEINLIPMDRLDAPIRCTAKIRYRAREAACTAEQIGADEIRVKFDEPQRAITPGQACVLYDGDVVIGGGTIQ
ncbi:MAG: tRNA 2-thiouridine(34) synthase MnmA [Oscillospiraceae bacterium]|jgi:tRNA-specific 2-thiouridylase|nr:tRNA 2-thiouridine(34) synthase MnmA [Oscillospiraceae bacterium]